MSCVQPDANDPAIATPPAWLADSRSRFEQALRDHFVSFETQKETHSRLPDAVQYAILGNGKRLRPILVLESTSACGTPIESAIPAAIAIECVHTFSLVHDDLPAMDDDDLRRGRPTVHRQFDEAEAILAGDWLLTHAFEIVAAARVSAATRVALVSALASGTTAMIAGQSADIGGEGMSIDAERVAFIHRHKTAALFEAACRLGGLCAAADERQLAALVSFGRQFGLAFQITDDLLDATGQSVTTGKRVGKDAARGKQTYPAAFGLESSRIRAREAIDLAIDALREFDDGADRLRELARYLLTRVH